MTDIDIHGLKAAAQKLSLPLSPSWMAGGIRHLNKNVDSDAFWDEPEGGDGFTPGRYEGETMATVLNAVPALLALADAAEMLVSREHAFEKAYSYCVTKESFLALCAALRAAGRKT